MDGWNGGKKKKLLVNDLHSSVRVMIVTTTRKAIFRFEVVAVTHAGLRYRYALRWCGMAYA
jgi:hypothetical protein